MLFTPAEAVFAQAIADLGFTNRFDQPEVARLEQLALSVDLPDEVKRRRVPLRSVAERQNIPELLHR